VEVNFLTYLLKLREDSKTPEHWNRKPTWFFNTRIHLYFIFN
jgi:hypothetical protein